MDKLYILVSKNKMVNGYICTIRESAKKMQEVHRYNIITTAIASRAVASAVLVSGNLKNRKDELIFKWQCTGPINSIVVDVDYEGKVIASVGKPDLELIEDSLENGSIKAEPYIGFGELVVMRKAYDGRPPYVSVTVLESGEIAHDVSVFLNQSLQVDCAMKIALSLTADNQVEVCAGVLFMAMPGSTEKDIEDVYEKFNSLGSLTDLLKKSDSEDLNSILKNLDMELVSERVIKYQCGCNREKIVNFLIGLESEEFTAYIMDDGKISATCEFCNREYKFDPAEIENAKKSKL